MQDVALGRYDVTCRMGFQPHEQHRALQLDFVVESAGTEASPIRMQQAVEDLQPKSAPFSQWADISCGEVTLSTQASVRVCVSDRSNCTKTGIAWDGWWLRRIEDSPVSLVQSSHYCWPKFWLSQETVKCCNLR